MVSVIIPTYKANQNLHRAIRSVLNQSYADYEILVIDDNDPESESRKITESLMECYADEERVRYIKHEKNMNGAFARNTGLNAARGELICFLDDDDFYLKNRIDDSVKYLDNHDVDGVCFGVAVFMNDRLNYIFQQCGKVSPEYLLMNRDIGSGSNIFVRKNAIEKIKGFDTRFSRFQDIEFMLRLCQNSDICFDNKILVIKDNSLGANATYEKVSSATDFFLESFAREIRLLKETDRKVFYDSLYRWLLTKAKKDGNKKEIHRYARRVIERGIPVAADKISFALPGLMACLFSIKERLKATDIGSKLREQMINKNQNLKEEECLKSLGIEEYENLMDVYRGWNR